MFYPCSRSASFVFRPQFCLVRPLAHRRRGPVRTAAIVTSKVHNNVFAAAIKKQPRKINEAQRQSARLCQPLRMIINNCPLDWVRVQYITGVFTRHVDPWAVQARGSKTITAAHALLVVYVPSIPMVVYIPSIPMVVYIPSIPMVVYIPSIPMVVYIPSMPMVVYIPSIPMVVYIPSIPMVVYIPSIPMVVYIPSIPMYGP